MEDKVVTIVFGSLGATLALISILFAYLQLRGFRPAIAPDEEQAVALAAVAQEDFVTDTPAVVVEEGPVINPPYASSLATHPYDRANVLTDATPRTDLLSAINCQRQRT
jgi:hypothetical protein